MRSTLLTAAVVLTSTPALAQPQDQTPSAPSAPAARDGRRITVMWAPLRALFGLAEVTGEYRIADKLGVSVELGGGRRTLTFDTGGSMTDLKSTEYEVGAQARYYVLGSYTHGMELGAEILDEYVDFDEPLPANVAAAAAGGLTTGAFAGYKIATRVGFTFEAQLGARYLLAQPPVTAGMGMPVTVEQRWLPMLHLNAGWTFW